MNSPSYSFIAGDRGSWEVVSMDRIVGAALEEAPFLDVRNEYVMKVPVDFRWLLRGVSSSRNTPQLQNQELMTPWTHFGRDEICCAAFMPVKWTRDWWDLTEDERRSICGCGCDSKSVEIPTRIEARRFHHSRELGEPFDFLMWFEYARADTALVDELVAAIRESEEWKYVEREADVRLLRSRMRNCA